MSKNFFKRKEKKYLLSREQFEKVRAKIEKEMAHDGFFESEIYNVYFDNAQNELISQAIQSEGYKCKVRARNYGKNYAEEAFLEIKSKTDENCERYFKNPTFIMETKTVEGFPSWLVDFLSKNKIYPSSFSKYGKIYQQNMYNLRSKNV